ncbi:MAG: RNA methyltransferase, partial [Pseudomonadota bacterium]
MDGVDGTGGRSPAIILVEPQMGENIGGAARAMLNFGLTDLRLAAPRDGWPNEKALTMAAGAKRVVADAKLFDTAAQSVSDLHFVVATTARRRDISLPVAAPREAVAALREKRAAGLACGVLFGAERAGLTTDQVALADMIVTMPVNPEFGS